MARESYSSYGRENFRRIKKSFSSKRINPLKKAKLKSNAASVRFTDMRL